MGRFRELKVWQRGKDLAVYIYKVTNKGEFAGDFSLKDQIRDAAVSVPSNVAEGDELGTDKQSIRHFFISKGSAAEILTQAIISFEIGYLTEDEYRHIEKESQAISGMLMRLIQSRSKKLTQ
jgi:four helix bundle protein